MRIILFFLLIIFILHQNTNAQLKYQGGMLFHSGYLKIEHNNYKDYRLCHGLGGQLSFLITDHLRLGSEGYTSSLNYAENSGIYRLGWGGLLLGYQVGSKKLSPVINLTFGGGRVNDMQFVEVNTKDYEIDRIIYHKYTVMIASPSISLEYTFKSKYAAVFKIDYLIPLKSSGNDNFFCGPRFYIGLFFKR
jgi:hypothetical protein